MSTSLPQETEILIEEFMWCHSFSENLHMWGSIEYDVVDLLLVQKLFIRKIEFLGRFRGLQKVLKLQLTTTSTSINLYDY